MEIRGKDCHPELVEGWFNEKNYYDPSIITTVELLLRRTLLRSVILLYITSIVIMNLSDFQSAAKGEISFSDFFLKIKSEVDAYRSIISGKKGTRVSIYLEEDVDDFTLTANHVKKLGHSF